jgi:predicted DNA-binding transcriptional regulator AlpA
MNARTIFAPQPIDSPRMIAYVCVSTLAQLLEIGETTVWDLVKKGQLPKPRRIGGSTRWSWIEVTQMLDAETKEAVEDEDPILRASRGR